MSPGQTAVQIGKFQLTFRLLISVMVSPEFPNRGRRPIITFARMWWVVMITGKVDFLTFIGPRLIRLILLILTVHLTTNLLTINVQCFNPFNLCMGVLLRVLLISHFTYFTISISV